MNQAGDRLIDLSAIVAMVGAQATVRVPCPRPAAAMLNLNEANASLDQTPRYETLLAEIARCRIADTIKALRFLRLGARVEDFG